MQDTDFEWYKTHVSELYSEFGAKCVTIKNKTILGVYDTYADGVLSTQKTWPLGTFIVQKLGPDETAYTEYIYSF